MNKDDPVEIRQVGNGFVVQKPYDLRHGDRLVYSYDAYLVFRTMAELSMWLSDHFTHRDIVDSNDKMRKVSGT